MDGLTNVRTTKRRITVGFKGLKTSLDDELVSLEYAADLDNFSFDKGVLTGKFGIDKAEGFLGSQPKLLPAFKSTEIVKDVFVYKYRTANGVKDDRIVVHLTDGRFLYTHYYYIDKWHEFENLRLYDKVSCVNYNYDGEDVFLISSVQDGLFIIKNETPYVNTEAPKFSSIEIHGERVWGSVNGKSSEVWFSDDLSPINWNVSATEAGHINFTGELGDVIKLVSFLNYLFIFRENGIYRLSAYGDQSDFELKKVFTDTGRIYKDSIVMCGNKIVFYAEDGLFAFDGYSVTGIAKELPSVAEEETLIGAYKNECYYLFASSNGESNLNKGKVIKYSFKDGSISKMSGVDVISAINANLNDKSKIICAIRGANALGEVTESGKISDANTVKHYKSPYGTMGFNGFKTVRCVSFMTDYPVTLRVILDGKNYDYAVDGSAELQRIYVEKSGVKIGFELIANGQNARITPLKVDVDFMTEGL